MWTRLASIAATVGALAGCGLVLDLDADGVGGDRDAGAGPIDARAPHDSDRADSVVVGDVGMHDDGAADGGGGDRCSRTFAGDVVALYRFDGDVADSLGAGPEGDVVPPIAFIDTLSDCEQALTFPGPATTNMGYGTLPAGSFWNQPIEGIDLWFRLDAHDGMTAAGILSRDATGPSDGHITLVVTASRQLGVRLQTDIGTNEALCSSSEIPTETWIHIAIELGATARLFIDGIQQSFVGSILAGDEAIRLDCVGAELADRTIAGNDEPWVIGAAAWRTGAGMITPTSAPLVGAVDHLRFWRGPVDFGAP